MTRSETRRLQQHLNRQGLGPLIEDGIYGPVTESAYQQYLRLHTPIDLAPAPPAARPWWTNRAQVGWLLAIILSLLSKWLGVELDADTWIPPILDTLAGLSALIGLWGNTTQTAPIDPTLVAPGLRLGARRARADASRMSPEPLPSGSDATGDRNPSTGFPDGPFFDS